MIKTYIKRIIQSHYTYYYLISFFIALFLIQYPLLFIDAFFYDTDIKYDFTKVEKPQIVLVTLDDESDLHLGETFPYSYASHLRFMEKISASEGRPLLMSYLMQLPENDRPEDDKFAVPFKNTIKNFIASGGHFRFSRTLDMWGPILPPSFLLDLGHSLAILNVDNFRYSKDDISRRAVLATAGEESLHLWAANIYRLAQGQPRVDAKSLWGAYFVNEANTLFALYKYPFSPLLKDQQLPTISFHRVVTGNYPKDFFKDKLVLVGPQYSNKMSDHILTPFSKDPYAATKLSLHGVILEAMIQKATVLYAPEIFSKILAALLIIGMPILILRLTPLMGLLMTLVLGGSICLFSYLCLCIFNLWFPPTHVLIANFIAYYIWVPIKAMSEYQKRFKFQEETKIFKKVEGLKQNFISLISHDLKTPIAKIAGLVGLLELKDRTPEDQSQVISELKGSVHELNRYVTAILDLAKIESSDFKLNYLSKDINAVIESVVNHLALDAKSKNMSFELLLSPLYPITLDVELMRRVLLNLVENAIKYAGSGSVITLKTWDEGKWVFVQISDNGVGMAPRDLEHIFDKFYRAKNNSDHNIRGTGLGLYLVKYFVELHKGTITAASTPGQGTSFTLKLINA